METEFILPIGAHKGTPITSKRISLAYLRELEEDLLLKGRSTSDVLMRALDQEIKRREKKLTKFKVELHSRTYSPNTNPI